MISVIVITKNEEDRIKACLESVKWADQLIVYDNGSTDKTLDIAKKYTEDIFEYQGNDFSALRNAAMEKAAGDWVLYVDADERVLELLREEVMQIAQSSDKSAFALSRTNIIFGQDVHYGPYKNDWMIRYFKKDKFKKWVGQVHEHGEFEGDLGYTKNSLLHLTHRDIDHFILKSLDWSKIDAKLRLDAGHPLMTKWRFARILLTETWEQGVKRKGFFSGTVGMIDSVLQVFFFYMTYVRLWQMQQSKPLDQTYNEIDKKLIETTSNFNDQIPLLKIGIYSPYLDTVGGGEKYMLTIAEYLSKLANVDLLLDKHLFSLDIHQVLKKMEQMHDMDLSKLNLVQAPIGPGSSMFSRMGFLRKYDVLICNTDGSVFPSTAKKSFIHFQVPFTNTNAKGIFGKLKMMTWKEAVYNSKFTKQIIEKTWPVKGRVIYPPVNVDSFAPSQKKKYILSVGRFFSVDKSKKHQLMIQTFKKIVDEGKLKDWALYLAGGATPGDMDYLHELDNMSKGYRIYLYPNISFGDLQMLYSHSSIYWHAKGYGEKDPKTFEHFGISTVEAMASGCVPIVIKLGGQLEIVEDEVSGCFWNTLEELGELTIKVAENEKLRNSLAEEAVRASKKFSKQEFENQIHKLVFEN